MSTEYENGHDIAFTSIWVAAGKLREAAGTAQIDSLESEWIRVADAIGGLETRWRWRAERTDLLPFGEAYDAIRTFASRIGRSDKEFSAIVATLVEQIDLTKQVFLSWLRDEHPDNPEEAGEEEAP